MSANITIVGRLAGDPEIKFGVSGTPIAKFTVVSSGRKKTETGWEDVDVTFWNVTAFKRLAENICESLSKGNEVVLTGKIKIETYETAEGERRSRTEVIADTVAASLRFDPVKILKIDRPQEGRKQFQESKAALDDPWSAPDEIGF